MSDEQYKHVVNKLIEFIDRASAPGAIEAEAHMLPDVVRALAELQKV
ncbi:hypothetical protein [Oscillibacter sp.]|nr:hypothetical protein [Oscillibacter sp.]